MAVILPGGLLVLTVQESAFCVHAGRDLIACFDRDGLVPPEVTDMLARMREVAAEAGLARPAHRGSGGGSVLGPKMDGASSAASELMLTVHAAAEVAKVSERSIRKAIIAAGLLVDGSEAVRGGLSQRRRLTDMCRDVVIKFERWWRDGPVARGGRGAVEG